MERRRFRRRPLGAHTKDSLPTTFTAPTKKGALDLKVIQRCEVGLTPSIDTSKNANEPPTEPARKRWP